MRLYVAKGEPKSIATRNNPLQEDPSCEACAEIRHKSCEIPSDERRHFQESSLLSCRKDTLMAQLFVPDIAELSNQYNSDEETTMERALYCHTGQGQKGPTIISKARYGGVNTRVVQVLRFRHQASKPRGFVRANPTPV